ncbi:Os01g0249000 [Oryza sativa Japonica Group]|nr:Os01g0249000 [Oryza sativa Japonica Group]
MPPSSPCRSLSVLMLQHNPALGDIPSGFLLGRPASFSRARTAGELFPCARTAGELLLRADGRRAPPPREDGWQDPPRARTAGELLPRARPADEILLA